MSKKESITIEYAGRTLTISTGELANQASGSVLVQYDDTVVLVTAVADKKESQGDFLPLTENNYLGISRWNQDPNGFNGIMDDVRFYNRALTS